MVNLLLALLLPAQGITVGMPFLKLGVGARPVALGEAYTAVSDDANAMFWNPAGLGMMNQVDASVMIMDIYNAVTYGSGAVVFPVQRRGRVSMGLAGSYLYATDTFRNELGENQGTFRVSDALGVVGMGWKVERYLSLGINAKFVASAIGDQYHAYSVLGDLGVKVNPTDYTYFGAMVQHVGTPRSFDTGIEFAPTTFRGGLALHFPFEGSHLLFCTDLSWPVDEPPKLGVGGEFKLYIAPEDAAGSSGFSLRAGYLSGYHVGDWGGLSAGIGYEYEFSKWVHLSLDFVYFSYGFLGDSERLSASVNFRPSPER